ncbi:hypothetical protein [Bradyrhizobium sp. ARR65]|uniref:hypothetical protein n=1 Tax=Bradyrhizobium sp. ARR65 TaxID=1040989 RepID=UPI000464B232|nr:hypothetical protein [Bradyrhizobium sp. ARR65]
MHKLIRSIALAALLSSRTALGETVGLAKSSVIEVPSPQMQMARRAPIGHRQPQAKDVPSENPSDLERVSEEDRDVDRKLMICRGC